MTVATAEVLLAPLPPWSIQHLRRRTQDSKNIFQLFDKTEMRLRKAFAFFTRLGHYPAVLRLLASRGRGLTIADS